MPPGSSQTVRWRARAGLVAIVVVTLTGIAAAPAFGAPATVPVALTTAAVIRVLSGWPADRRRIALITGGAGLVSLAATAGVVWLDAAGPPAASGWLFGESVGLLILVLLAVRAAPVRPAIVSAGLAGVAVPLLLVRVSAGPPTPAALAGFAVWALFAVLAAVIGLYLRSLDDLRARSVRAARQEQRLRLARDLHDFVAHDVSEMLAQAQAGQILAEHDPEQALAMFGRIEHAALHALGSMDRTVRMLHDPDLGPGLDAVPERGADSPGPDVAAGPAAARTPLPALADLADLTERFSSSGTAKVRLDLDALLHEAERVPRDVSATAYRIVVESLTNVRRHARTASRVEVSVRRLRDDAGHALEVMVTDDARTGTTPDEHQAGGGSAGRRTAGGGARGGLGLAGLTERAEALGGTLTAGPRTPHGWHVTATLPLTLTPSDLSTAPAGA
ncbi:ATP-binding protein [Nonomuraea fuscirosea]|uniref:ATP-binding protein n=1 Tax=Nonomuraea fuscirosea TaxID=1291556 RepID=UPI000D05E3B4|nr:ATP-binding protein [Nonomuraea fuscirosea]